VEAKNRKEAAEIDRIFLIKQQRERETADAEQQVTLTSAASDTEDRGLVVLT
jgi:hypothetical protein